MKKFLEITGYDFKNKGAQLMLQSVIDEFKNDLTTTLVSDFTNGTFEQRTSLGLQQKFRITSLQYDYRDKNSEETAKSNMARDVQIYKEYFNNTFGKSMGLVNPEDINVILDISGFRFTEKNIRSTSRCEFLYRTWKEEGKKIILLPQAFGPFDDKNAASTFVKLLEHVDLVYARDNQSYDFIMKVCPTSQMSKVKRSPDFTCLLKPKRKHSLYSQKVCIIPNYRMIDKTNSDVGNWYLSVLKQLSEYLKLHKKEFFYLIHDSGGEDYELANSIRKSTDIDFEIVSEASPTVLKEIISSSSYVIGSRYHALIGALTTRVPTLGIGWSHKYEELFSDFNCLGNLIPNLLPHDDVISKLNEILKSDYHFLQRQLDSGIQLYEEKSNQMWSEVKEVISGHSPKEEKNEQ